MTDAWPSRFAGCWLSKIGSALRKESARKPLWSWGNLRRKQEGSRMDMNTPTGKKEREGRQGSLTLSLQSEQARRL